MERWFLHKQWLQLGNNISMNLQPEFLRQITNTIHIIMLLYIWLYVFVIAKI